MPDIIPATAAAGIPVGGQHKVYVQKARFDTKETNRAANAVVAAIPVPDDTYVIQVLIKVITAEGAAASIDVGDGNDADRFADGATTNATGGSTGTSTSHYYVSADTIDVTFNNAMDAAVFEVIAIMASLNMGNFD